MKKVTLQTRLDMLKRISKNSVKKREEVLNNF